MRRSVLLILIHGIDPTIFLDRASSQFIAAIVLRTIRVTLDLDEAHVREYNDNRPTEDTTDIELIIDFYRRFIYRMEYMMRVGEEKGYNLISFMGP